MSGIHRILFNVVVLLGFMTVAAQAQTGRILGSVSDQSGAVLPGATVIVTSLATNISRDFVTDSTGNFDFPNVAVGEYSIRTEMVGFKAHQTKVLVEVAQVVRQNIRLEVGEISETVDVLAQAPMLQTDKSEIGQVVNNRQIVELPLNGRDYTQLVLLAPGVIYRGDGLSMFGGATVTINGARPGQENYLVDGVTTQASNTRGPQIVPSIESLQEFKIQTSSYAAEFGRGTAMVNVTTKSGTNAFHGNLYEFWRNDKLAANDFFQNQLADPDSTGASLNRNQFGGSLGGPIVKDRAFFFVNYEGERLRQGRTRTFRVPTALEKAGDFSQTPGVTAINDPLVNQPFADKKIPSQRFHQSYLYFRDWWPTPNAPGNLLISAPKINSNADQFSARADYTISDSDSVFIRYFDARRDTVDPGVGTQPGLLENFTEDVRDYQVVGHWTHSFSPRLLFDFQYSRVYHQGVGVVGPNCFKADGCTNHVVASGIKGMEFTSDLFPGAPQISFGTGWAQLAGTRDPIAVTYPTDSWRGDLTWIRGSHTFKGGFDFYSQDLDTRLAIFARGVFSMPGATSGGRTPWSDFVLGWTAGGRRAVPTERTGIDYRNFHYYFQDDWKVSPNLTVNLGLRYEYNLFPTALFGGAAVDPQTGKLIFADLDGDGNPQNEGRFSPGLPILLPLVQGALVSTTELGLAPSMIRTDRNNLAPRLGLAWRPWDKTVIRAGYGIYYLTIANGNIGENMITSLPFSMRQNAVPGSIDKAFAPFESISRILPSDWSPFALDANQAWPYEQQYTLSIQHSLANDLLFETAYVGKTAIHLVSRSNIVLPASRPAFVPANTTLHDSHSTSNYHGWQNRLEKRYSGGLAFSAAYTWSKAMDISSEDRDTGGVFTQPGVSDFDIPHRFVANMVWDLPFGYNRRWLANRGAVVDALLGGWQWSLISQFQSGYPFSVRWAAGNTTNARVATSTIPNRTSSGKLDNPTPERWFDPTVFVPNQKPPDPSAPGTFLPVEGNAGRNSLRTDGMSNWDIGLMKNFFFGGEQQYRLQFRAEMFNAFNHVQFSAPGSTNRFFGRSANAVQIRGSADDAKILSTNSVPRQVQFALKLFF